MMIKTIVLGSSPGLMKVLALTIFVVGMLFLNSCANLISAAQYNDIAGVNALLVKGADVNVRDEDGTTALILASTNGNVEIVNALLAKGADVNAKNNHGTSALIQALKVGSVEIVNALLAKGADVNATDEDGTTALMWASKKGIVEIVNSLISKGANVNATDKNGTTALMMASERGEPAIVEALLVNGAKIKFDKNITKDAVGTMLMAAVSNNNLSDIAKMLLNRGANPNYQAPVTTVQITLIDNGYSIGSKTEPRGETVLVRAILPGNIEMVKLLLEKGANPNAEVIEHDSNVSLPEVSTGLDPSFGGDIYYGGGKAIIRSEGDMKVLGFGPPPPKLLEKYKPPLTTTAIAIARKNGNAEMVQLLKEAGSKE